MTGFDPYDPVDPMGQFNNDPLYPDSGPIPGDPMFQDDLRQASDQVLRRAKEQAIDPMVRSDVQQELWSRQAMRTEPLSLVKSLKLWRRRRYLRRKKLH